MHAVIGLLYISLWWFNSKKVVKMTFQFVKDQHAVQTSGAPEKTV